MDVQVLVPCADRLFARLRAVGFRNIHRVIHLQTENFARGMPTDLAFRLAARRAVFAHLKATRGQGWWGKGDLAAYYPRQDAQGSARSRRSRRQVRGARFTTPFFRIKQP